MILSFITRTLTIGSLAAALVLVLPLITRADNDTTETDTAVSAEVKAEVRVDNQGPRNPLRRFFGNEQRQERNRPEEERDTIKDERGDDAGIIDDNNRKRENVIQVRDRTGANIEERREEAETRRDTAREKREDLRERAEEEREKGRANAVTRIKAHLARYVHILEAGINRMETLKERVQARADKMEANGADVTEAEIFLVTAQVEIDAASADLAFIQVTIDADTEITASTTPATAFEEVRDLLKSSREHIRNAFKALKDAVQSLQGVRVEAEVETESD